MKFIKINTILLVGLSGCAIYRIKNNYLLKILVVLFSLSGIKANGQKLVWAHSFGDSYKEWIEFIESDKQGNTYIVGTFLSDTIDVDPGPSTNFLYGLYGQHFLLKLNANGDFQWVNQFGGFTLKFFSLDDNGNAYLSGFYGAEIDFDPGPGVHKVPKPTYGSSYLLKLNHNGQFVWVKTWSDPIPYVTGWGNYEVYVQGVNYQDGNFLISLQYSNDSIDLDPDTNFVYNVYRNNISTVHGSSKMALFEIDTAGSFKKALLGRSESHSLASTITDIKIGKNKDYYMSGSTYGLMDYDPGPDTIYGTGNGMFLLKLDSNLNYKWHRVYEVNAGGTLYNLSDWITMVLDKNENIIINGQFTGVTDFNTVSGVNQLSADHRLSSNNFDIFTLQVDSSGTYNWAFRLGDKMNQKASGVQVDKRNNVYTASMVQDTVYIDPDTTSSTFVRSLGGLDSYIHIVDQSSNLDTVYQLNGVGITNTQAFKLDPFGNMIMAGKIIGPTDFDLGPGVKILNSTGNNYSDIFVAKWCFPKDTALNLIRCKSFTSPSGKYLWDTTGVYYDTISTKGFCDSLITVYLTMNSSVDTSIYRSSNKLFASSLSTSYQWIRCDGDSIVPGATDSVYTVDDNGDYACIVSQNGCIDTTTCLTVNDIGIKEINELGIKIYPNPTSGDILIDLNSEYSYIKVEIFNAQGIIHQMHEFENQNRLQIQLKGRSGVFYLKCTTGEGASSVKKIIKI